MRTTRFYDIFCEAEGGCDGAASDLLIPPHSRPGDGGVMLFFSRREAVDMARAHGWREIDGRQLCPECVALAEVGEGGDDA